MSLDWIDKLTALEFSGLSYRPTNQWLGLEPRKIPMSKIKAIGMSGNNRVYVFFCPGCLHDHAYEVPRWEWNGSLDKPTFTPSLMNNANYPESRCHLAVTDGVIHFYDDCHHDMKGKDIPMFDYDED